MYRLSARQILGIALLSALFAAASVVVFNRLTNHFEPNIAAFTEGVPSGITDPSLATEEQNNVEVYKAISPGVANISTTQLRRDMFGSVSEGEGSGPASFPSSQPPTGRTSSARLRRAQAQAQAQ